MISENEKGGGGLRVTKVMMSVNASYLDGNIVLLTRTCEIQIQINLPFVDNHDHHVVPCFDVVFGQFSFCSDKQQKQEEQQQQQQHDNNSNHDRSNSSRNSNSKKEAVEV